MVALETVQRQASIHEAKAEAGRAGGIASGLSRKQKRSKPEREREPYREDKRREEKNQSREEEREKSAREFLSLYPKATNHDKAVCAYMSEITSQELHDALMDGLKRWLESAQWQDSLKEDGGRYVANADRFITDRLWKENPPPRKPDAFEEAAKMLGL